MSGKLTAFLPLAAFLLYLGVTGRLGRMAGELLEFFADRVRNAETWLERQLWMLIGLAFLISIPIVWVWVAEWLKSG